MEKQAYALVKSLKDFRVYVLHSHIIAYVPSNVVKSILTQPDLERKRAKWIEVLLEYDIIQINPTQLIKGQGLAKMKTDSNCESLQLNFLFNHSNQLDTKVQVSYEFSMSPWYFDIVYVLQNLQAPSELSRTKAMSIKLKVAKFSIMNGYLYWRDPEEFFLIVCLKKRPKSL